MLRKGFTLIEVIVTLVIIGILTAIALPQFKTVIEKARSSEAVTNAISIKTSIDRYWYQNRYTATPFPPNFDALDIENPNLLTNKAYNYTFTDDGTDAATREYTVRGERIGDPSYWVRWIQTNNNTGKLYKSNNLGGPES